MLIADEVQTGFGRTGRCSRSSTSASSPTSSCVAKSIAAGRAALRRARPRRDHGRARATRTIGGTYVGNPLACVAALAVLDEIDRRDLLRARPTRSASAMRARFERCRRRVPQLGDVRGLGPMLALEFVRDPATREPAPELATRVAEDALQRGLMLLKAGIHGQCLRVLLPLVATDEQIDEALDVFEETLTATLGAAASAAPVAGAAR